MVFTLSTREHYHISLTREIEMKSICLTSEEIMVIARCFLYDVFDSLHQPGGVTEGYEWRSECRSLNFQNYLHNNTKKVIRTILVPRSREKDDCG